jgi:RNA polymerase sigma factor (TIGR02999 family)
MAIDLRQLSAAILICAEARRMDNPAHRDVTRLLDAAKQGDPAAADELLPLVYAELRRLAASYLNHERPDHTLQATALVHEAYLKLVGQTGASFNDRRHFFAVAATAMRRILVNHAKSKKAGKRGGGQAVVALDDAAALFRERAVDLVALDESLDRLSAFDPELARLVELRFFGGLSVEEIAQTMDASTRTVERNWSLARAWLRGELTRGETE